MSNSMSKEIEDQCPGNFREKCGDSEGMSVYKTDIAFYDSRGGQCVYATWNGSIFLEPGSCKKMIRSVCSDADKSGTESNGCKDSNEYDQCRSGICVTCKRATWLKASLNCHLMNVTNENKEMLFDFLSNIKCQKDYWINLRVLKMKMWINGSETNNRTHSIGRNRTCLALEYSDFNNWTRHWKPCSEVYRALCDNAQLAYSAHKGMNLGVYLGSGVGLILLIGLLTAVLVACKRKDQKCFQRQQRAIGNDDQIRDPGTQGDIIAPSDKSVNFVVQPLSAAQAQATPEELYTQVAKTQREGFDENVYDRAGESRNPMVVENFYSHVTVDVENDYDIAGRKPEMERRDSIYNHLDYKRVDQEEEEVTM